MENKTDKAEIFRNKVQTLLRSMTISELYYTLGHYCGPSNSILCKKKYGFSIPAAMVESELKDRIVEDALFGSDS